MTDRKSFLSACIAPVIAPVLVGLLSVSALAGSEFSLDAAAPAAPSEADHNGLLQQEMKDRGFGGDMLDQYGLKLNGYVDVGWTFNFVRPPQGFNGSYFLFNDKTDDPNLNQLSLSLSREAIVSGDRFDSGFNVQVVYGADMRFTQANGTNFYGSSTANQQLPLASNNRLLVIVPGQEFPENQLSVLQGYVTFNLPYNNGLLLTAGKFVTPWGQETTDPTKNLLYTHSYMFGVGQPFTLTGVMGDYRIDDQWRAKAGLVVGWDQSLQDNNDFPSGFAQVGYKYSDDLDLAVTVMAGPEKPDNRADFRWLLDATADYRIDNDWKLGAEVQVGYELDTTTTLHSDGSRLFLFGDGAWFGGAIYSSYKLDNEGMYVLQARGEYFNDNKGVRQLISEVYSGTIGLNIRPLINDRIGKHLVIRPELRWDWALDHIFDGETRQQQVLASIDAVFEF